MGKKYQIKEVMDMGCLKFLFLLVAAAVFGCFVVVTFMGAVEAQVEAPRAELSDMWFGVSVVDVILVVGLFFILKSLVEKISKAIDWFAKIVDDVMKDFLATRTPEEIQQIMLDLNRRDPYI